MSPTEVAGQHAQARRRLIRGAEREAVRAWRDVSREAIAASWAALSARVSASLVSAQAAAAGQAASYTARMLGELGVDDDPAGEIVADAFSGVASDGRPLDTLLLSPVVHARRRLGRGEPVDRAMAAGEASLRMIVRTQVADAGRAADGVAVAARPGVGWVRHLTPPSCGRCAVLAGRFYRYSDGFARHPACDCVHVPASESAAGELTSDPRAYFDSLSEAEQDRQFTRAGAQAIRDGADISQVVNARRGALGLSQAGRLTRAEQAMLRGGRARGRLQTQDVFGRELATTTEGATSRGVAGRRLQEATGTVTEAGETVTRQARTGSVTRQVQRQRARAPRLMPESIYEIAEDRAHVIELLRRNGYIL